MIAAVALVGVVLLIAAVVLYPQLFAFDPNPRSEEQPPMANEANAAALARLTAAVENDRTVNQSAATLLGQLSQLIRDSANDPAAMIALADSLDQNQADLAAAVAANTPAAAEEPVDPVDPENPASKRRR